MARYVTAYKEVEVDMDISDIDTDDLIDELGHRGIIVPEQEIEVPYASAMYDAFTSNRTEEFEQLLKEFFYETIGRIA